MVQVEIEVDSICAIGSVSEVAQYVSSRGGILLQPTAFVGSNLMKVWYTSDESMLIWLSWELQQGRLLREGSTKSLTVNVEFKKTG